MFLLCCALFRIITNTSVRFLEVMAANSYEKSYEISQCKIQYVFLLLMGSVGIANRRKK